MSEGPQQGVDLTGSGDEEGDVTLARTDAVSTAFGDVPPADDPAGASIAGDAGRGESSDLGPLGSRPKAVVADRGVAEVFAEVEASSHGDTTTADDPSAAATEKHLEIGESDVNMDVGRDGAAGGDPDDGDGGRTEADDSDLRAALEDVSFDDEDDSSGIGAFVEEDESLLEQTGDGTHRAVGESDVDGVFEVFEECTPQDVMDSTDDATTGSDATADPDTPSGPDTTVAPDPMEGAGDDVASLCSNLSEVDLDPVAAPDSPAQTDAGSEPGPGIAPPPDPEETAQEVEGLLGDLSTPEVDTDVEVGADAGVAAGDLVTDLSTVDDGTDDPTAEAEPSASGPGDAGGFQWLGEDVHILDGESDVDGVFEEFEESTPEEVMAADETAFFEAAATAETPADGWSSVPVDPGVDVSATDLYDSVETDPPSVVGEADPAGSDDSSGDDSELWSDAEGEESDGTADRLDDAPTADAADSSAVEGPVPDAGASSAGTDTASPDPGVPDPDPDAIDDAIDQALDGIDSARETAGVAPGTSGDGTDPDDATAGAESGTDAGTTSASSPTVGGGSPATDDTTGPMAGGTAGAGGVTGERDVDAVFERFEEDTPEDVIGSDDGTAGHDPVVAGVEDIAAVMGDLSTVDLVPREPSDETPAGPVPDPGSEEAEAEVETLLGDLGTVDLTPVEPEPEPESKPEPVGSTPTAVETAADSPGTDDVLERTGEDTHVAVGNSDVDAMFERFEEESPEEVAGETGWDSIGVADDDPSGGESSGSTLGDASPDDLFDGVSKASDAQSGGSGDAGTARDTGDVAPPAGDDIVEDATEHASDSGPAASTSERVSDALSGDDEPPTVARRDEQAEPLFPSDEVEEEPDGEDEELPRSTVGAVIERILDLGSRFKGLF